MPPAPTAQIVFPFCDHPEGVPRSEQLDTAAGLDQLLLAAFADRSRRSGFLPQAEDGVRARPGDGHILLLAATAALLDEEPRRAQVCLKRFSKRYVATDSSHLLRALVGSAFLGEVEFRKKRRRDFLADELIIESSGAAETTHRACSKGSGRRGCQ